MTGIRLDVYTHCVRVTGFHSEGRIALADFCRMHLSQWGLVRVGYNQFKQQIVRVFAARTNNVSEYRFHINMFEDLVNHLKGRVYPEDAIEIIRHPAPAALKVKFNTKKLKVPREKQIGAIEYLKEPTEPIRLVIMQPGAGKTLVALTAIASIGERTAVVVKAMYVDRWVQAIKEELSCKPGELLVVRGTKDLNKLIDLAQSGELVAKFIIISNTTMRIYLDLFEKNGTTRGLYLCDPGVFYETLGVGVHLIDEVHMDFFLNFRMYLYLHVRKTIALTATFKSDTPFMNKMYDLAFPLKIRFSGIKYDKYIKVTALEYKIKEPTTLRWIRKAIGAYSHVELEESIMKDRESLRRYLNLINSVVYEAFLRTMCPGQKMLIFCATVEMCKLVVQDLNNRYADLTIGKYTAEESYSVLFKNDITVSTLLSAGTAVDVPGLRITLMTTALNKGDSNEQALGRLRKLSQWPEIYPEFYYLFCRQIPQQFKYHEKKVKDFEGKVVSHKVLLMQDYI